MTNPDTAVIRARANAAAEGPWGMARWEDFVGTDVSYSVEFGEQSTNNNSVDIGDDKSTAAFIAHARTDVPELCDEVDRLRLVTDIIDPESVHREQRDEARVKLARLDAALTELVHHGDLTPTGKRVLGLIIRGAS